MDHFNLPELAASPVTIGLVALVLLIWAAWSAALLWRGTRKLVRSLENATQAIEQSPDGRAFAKDFEATDERLKEDPVLGSRWQEFDDSLVFSQKPVPYVRTTTRAATWFDLGLFRTKDIDVDLRYHAAMPNLLVGAGLFFTFVGLAIALRSASGVVSGEAAERTKALTALLGAASFKFFTSLVGLFLSILYALCRKYCLKQAEQALDAFIGALERRVPLLTLETLQQEANGILREQAERLESFSTDLAFNIGQAFDRSFDVRLGEHIQPLREAIEKLAGGMSSRNEDAMERMLDGFLQRLQGGAGDRMQDVAASLERLGGRLDGLQSGLGEATARMSQSADTMASRMGEGAEAALSTITDRMSGLVDGLRAVADETRGAGAQAGRELADRLSAAAQGFEQAAQTVTAVITTSTEASGARMGREAEESAARLARQVETMVGELAQLADQNRTAGSQAMQTVAERIGMAATGFEETAAKVAGVLERAASETGGALGRGAEQAVERIAQATEGMREEMRTMIQEFKNAAVSAGEILRDSGTAGAEAVGTSLNGAGLALAASLTSVSDRLRDAGDAAGAALRGAGDAAGTRMEQAGVVFGGRAETLSGQVAALATATNGVARRIGEFERAAQEAAEPLVATSANLRAASEAARGAVEPITQAAHSLGRAGEQVAGAGQRIEVIQMAASRLVDGLTTAVGRFEGVDRDLARVLGELQTGLRGFVEQVSKAVRQTDDNLGKAAGQLGYAIENLEQTIEKLLDNLPPLRP